MGTWFVYILESQVNQRLYTGIAIDPYARCKKHNEGKGAKFTRTGRPWLIAYLEEMPDKSSALKREYAIKKLRKSEKLKLCDSPLVR